MKQNDNFASGNHRAEALASRAGIESSDFRFGRRIELDEVDTQVPMTRTDVAAR
ncbi:MAG TPA: hypothetical protein VMW70_04330 [Burkholderiales bacterium]|nr:hypothetical protein [Burkholderiales bacterium]